MEARVENYNLEMSPLGADADTDPEIISSSILKYVYLSCGKYVIAVLPFSGCN